MNIITPSEKNYIIGIVFILEIIITGILSVIGQPFRLLDAVSLYLFSLIILFNCIVEKKVNRNVIIIFLVAFIYYATVGVLNVNAGIGSVYTILVTMACMVSMDKCVISEYHLRVIREFSFFMVVIMTMGAFYIHISDVTYDTFNSRGTNSNTWALMLLYYAMIYATVKSKDNKKMGAIISCISVIGTYNCRSRFMTIAAFCFLILYCVPYTIINEKRLRNLTTSIIIFGTLFPALFISMYNTGFSMRINGKRLFTGREQFWMEAFAGLFESSKKILFGLGSNTFDDIPNMHSIYVSILVNFGIVGYLLFFSFILYIVKLKSKCVNNEMKKDALLIFIIGTLLNGTTDTTLLWSAMFAFSYIGLGMVGTNVE